MPRRVTYGGVQLSAPLQDEPEYQYNISDDDGYNYEDGNLTSRRKRSRENNDTPSKTRGL